MDLLSKKETKGEQMARSVHNWTLGTPPGRLTVVVVPIQPLTDQLEHTQTTVSSKDIYVGGGCCKPFSLHAI